MSLALSASELVHWVPVVLLACVLGTISPLSGVGGATYDIFSLLWLRSLPATAMLVGLPGPFLGGGAMDVLDGGDGTLLLFLLVTISNSSALSIACEMSRCLIVAV